MSLILYVEDDSGTQFLVSRILGKNGHEFVFANNGQEGWERLNQMQAEGRLPDLILSGVAMPPRPGGDGVGLCNRIKVDPLYQAIPLVFLTGNPEERLVKGNCKYKGYLAKPFSADE